MTTSSYTVIEILNIMTDYLKKKKIENARLNAELLAGHVLKLNRVHLYLNFERPLQQFEVDELRKLLARRSNFEPIQYILGETEFYSLKLKVTPDTLIPRPETEILVEKVIEICRQKYQQNETISILDIGTGSGNIAIALAKNMTTCNITAIDKNPVTLKIAEENANFHSVSDRIKFIVQDIFENFDDSFPHFDVIVSNPPYVSEKEFEMLPVEVKKFEPEVALQGGDDGANFYRRIVDLAKKNLQPEGFLAVEIGESQGKIIMEIFEKINSFKKTEVIKDMAQRFRIVVGYRN